MQERFGTVRRKVIARILVAIDEYDQLAVVFVNGYHRVNGSVAGVSSFRISNSAVYAYTWLRPGAGVGCTMPIVAIVVSAL